MISIGINQQANYSKELLDALGHIKAKKYVLKGVREVKALGKPVLLHGRFPKTDERVSNNFCYPGFFEWFKVEEFKEMVRVAKPTHLSFHIGLAAEMVEENWDGGKCDKALSPTLPEKEIFKRIKEGILRLKEAFPRKHFLLENMPYQPRELSGAFEFIWRPEFVNGMLAETDCGFLLDVAHAECTAATQSLDFWDYLKQLPLRKVKEIHVTKTSRKKWGVFDSHDLIDGKEQELLSQIIPSCPNLTHITIENESSPEKMLAQVKLLQKIV